MNNSITPEKSITSEQKIQRDDSFIEAPIDNEIVLMSIENGKYYGMDAIASRIWSLLEQPTTLNAIIDTLTTEYDVERAQCETETLAFISLLQAENAIVV